MELIESCYFLVHLYLSFSKFKTAMTTHIILLIISSVHNIIDKYALFLVECPANYPLDL